MFIGRKKELKELNEKYYSNRKEFGVIYGRRRIGKSSLINEFLKDKNGILFQAKKDNAYGNLKSFSYQINKLLNINKNYVYSSYEEALDTLSSYFKNERFVIAIDEYPYIVEQDNSFSSVLQEFIDKSSDNVFLLLSGSDISLLKKEIEDYSSPLYKRRTFSMSINKLRYDEALSFFNGINEEEIISYLALMSTYPYYLSSIDFSISFYENIKKLLFNQYGAFFTLPDQVLSNSTKVQDVYNAILIAISHRKRSIKDISSFIHEEEAKVAKYLLTLLDSEIVIKLETFMGNKKTNYYEINDPLLKFYYSFIFINEERIKINGDIVFNENKENIDLFISHGFEEVSRLYIEYLNEEGKLEDVFNKPKVYRVENSILKRSIEIDGLSLSNNTLLIIECKYRNSLFDDKMLLHLKESVSIFPSKYKKLFYIFSKSGFNIKNKEDNVHLITLNELLLKNK